ncbi:hypothetical protein [Myroides odoratus]|jgi:two-component SAPR family response regulator|uniref:Uncharacterized protein n=1 Tax=Myroides odoratus TaxID=256 RepID=A0A9Q6Z8U7_MYROD|nr:hypothetical protein [Myroides odoratus]EHQ44469.1 hypothetical protein Myrod_3672 [Myroides odoratus DSM 2801]EKB03653.1 hypothetical protein HMPREF9716_03482 [Myroides odoratus CIP 103059]QQU01737.1 hypothetical protein I6I88_08360 [Myroides odoratus]WQD55980.1 hypothetical protein U0010_10625 [Myroides odoratus]STZ31808.1 Uncharacterised protein [Myroides odoratus]
MKTLNFLVIGKNTAILMTLKRIIEATTGWYATIMEDENGLEPFLKEHKVDIILLSAGLEELVEIGIKAYALCIDPDIKVIQHFGGGSGLLKSEVYSALPDLNHSKN